MGLFNEEEERRILQQKKDEQTAAETGKPLATAPPTGVPPGDAPGSRVQSSSAAERPDKIINDQDAIFERLVYVFPYKSSDLLT